MTIPPKVIEANDVPSQIFEKFLQALVEAGVMAEVIERLRKTLLHDRMFTESALKDAVLGKEISR